MASPSAQTAPGSTIVTALKIVLLAGLVSLLAQGAQAASTTKDVKPEVAAAMAAPVASSDVADAVEQHDMTRLQTLLKAHADVNAPQPDGSTALHWATYQGDAIEITIHPLKDGTNGGSMMKAMVNGQPVGGNRPG